MNICLLYQKLNFNMFRPIMYAFWSNIAKLFDFYDFTTLARAAILNMALKKVMTMELSYEHRSIVSEIEF
jgi:hypothetical protein